MKLGLVIGTYGHLPAVRLQLAARAALYPDVPCLISDDGSDESAELSRLCAGNNAGFRSNQTRLGCSRGDLSVFDYGLRWAYENNIDYLLKLSTRFVFKTDWRDSLEAEITDSRMPIIGMRIMHTACLALDVKFWVGGGWADKVRALSAKPHDYHSPHRENAALDVALYVEGEMRTLSVEMFGSLSPSEQDRTRGYITQNRVHKPAEGGQPFDNPCWFRYWALLGHPEKEANDNVLWHKTSTPEDYAAYAARLGVDLGGEVVRLHHCFLKGKR